MFIAAVLILFVKDVDEKIKYSMMHTAACIFDLDGVIVDTARTTFWHGKD